VARALSAAEVAVAEALERIAAHPELNAVITVCADEALARARAGVSGRLAGVPLLVKDLIDTAGIRTTYASAIYRDHVPERSAPAVLALEAEGAIVVAKANADEFAWGTCGQNAHYGDTVNPRAPDRIAGGSSSGNAAALAAELVPLALGTDTGGSVRMPAGACGVVGLKPAHGAVSTAGVFVIDLVQYANFLLLLGSFFVPLFAVLLADWLVAGRHYAPADVFDAPAFRPALIAAWLAGFALYQWLYPNGPGWWTRIVEHAHPHALPWGGASLPSFAAAFALAALARVAIRRESILAGA
jgi:hypothetical protein